MRQYRAPLLISAFVLVTAPYLAFAATVTDFTGPIIPSVSDANGNLQTCAAGFGGLMQIVGGALGLIISLGILIAVLVAAYGGFLLVLNPVNAENRTTAKKVMLNAAVGLVITLAAWLLVNTFLNVIGAGGIQGATSKLLSGGGTCLAVKPQGTINGGGTATGPGGLTTGGGECPGFLICNSSNQCVGDPNLNPEEEGGNGAAGTACITPGSQGVCQAGLICDGTDTCATPPGAQNPISCTTTTGSGTSSGGSCTVQTSGACASSQMTAFGSHGDQASQICFAESSGNAHAEGDRIVGGSSNGQPVSFGLFQINITANPIGGLNCPSAFDSRFTGSHKNVAITNSSLYQQCKSAGEDPNQNIKAAGVISNGGTNWKPWSTASKCGLALAYFPVLALADFCSYN